MPRCKLFKKGPNYRLSWEKVLDERGNLVPYLVRLLVTNISMKPNHLCYIAEVTRGNLAMAVADIQEDYKNLEYQEEAEYISIAELIEARIF